MKTWASASHSVDALMLTSRSPIFVLQAKKAGTLDPTFSLGFLPNGRSYFESVATSVL
ncbi:MAG: hypothetical protein GY822_02705 [Deltaproteobacteria bacterium]|nr:hypothetical protein [Deltaproteobacteria bacterium]